MRPGDLVRFDPPPANGLTSTKLYERIRKRLGGSFGRWPIGIVVETRGPSTYVLFPGVAMWIMSIFLKKVSISGTHITSIE